MQCSGVGRAAEQRVGMVTPSFLATVRAHYIVSHVLADWQKGFAVMGTIAVHKTRSTLAGLRRA